MTEYVVTSRYVCGRERYAVVRRSDGKVVSRWYVQLAAAFRKAGTLNAASRALQSLRGHLTEAVEAEIEDASTPRVETAP